MNRYLVGNGRTTKRMDVTELPLGDRSDEILIAVAILGLTASISDGESDLREIHRFTKLYGRHFALSRRHAIRLIGAALHRMHRSAPEELLTHACSVLSLHLTVNERLRIFECIADILVADGVVHEGEEYYLDYLALKLDLVTELQRRYAAVDGGDQGTRDVSEKIT